MRWLRHPGWQAECLQWRRLKPIVASQGPRARRSLPSLSSPITVRKCFGFGQGFLSIAWPKLLDEVLESLLHVLHRTLNSAQNRVALHFPAQAHYLP